MNKKNSRLVYSTASGRIQNRAPSDSAASTYTDGIIRIHREQRKGSGVSMIKGLPDDCDFKTLAKSIKKTLGVGGSSKHGVIEIQSDQREKIKTLLEQQGFTVKLAGG